MSRAAKSVFIFGVYLLVTAAGLVTAPNVLLGTVGIAPTEDPWIRVLGIVVGTLGVYYIVAAKTGAVAFFRSSVWLRLFVLAAFAALAALSLAPAPLVIFGAVDALGAIWTFVGLRQAPAAS